MKSYAKPIHGNITHTSHGTNFLDLEYLKVNTMDKPVETLLSEAVFSSNSRVNKHTKLTPLQSLTGQQPVLPSKRGATERNVPYMYFSNKVTSHKHAWLRDLKGKFT